MLFHLQHQVNIGYYQPFNNDDYVQKKNADLKGASVLKIPYFLKFFTFGIEKERKRDKQKRVRKI